MNADKVPAALRERNQWVAWKIVLRDGKPTKLPFQKTGAAAKSNDPSTWTDFDSACGALRRGYPGVGFVFSESDEFCGIDLDGCRDPKTGVIATWAREILTKLDSYSEVSPSKTGVKVFVRGKSPWGAGKKFPANGAEKICDKEPAIEVYDKLRYFVVTSERLAGVSSEIEPRQPELQWLAREFGPKETPAARIDWQSEDAIMERAKKYLATMPVSVTGQGGHNAAFSAACRLVIDFALSEGQALAVLSEWNIGCQPPWSEKELRHKVSQASKQPGDRGRLRNAREDNWQNVKVVNYVLPAEQAMPEVRKTTLEQASFDRVKLIETRGDNLLDLSLPDLDYALGGGVEPGEMVIIAARPSHGKSAVALQVVHHFTGHGYPALIVSEEMSALALGKRTIQFASDVPKEHWQHSTQQLRRDLTDHFSSRAPCHIVESCKSVYRAAEEIRHAVKEDGIKLAVVDYAQLLVGKGKGRYEQISETSTVLRQIATETQVVLLALCQLSRVIESRKPFIPQPSDLRDSGQLEQDADVIVFVVWPHKLDSRNNPAEYQFFVAKNRNREINCHAFKCIFKPSRQMLVPEKPAAPTWGPAAEGWDTTFNPDNYEYPGTF